MKILAIEDDCVRYQSLNSSSKSRMKYSYLKLLLDGYEDLDPTAIQRSVNAVLKSQGFGADYSTENYAYSFAKAFRDRTVSQMFLSQGEKQPQDSSQSEEDGHIEGERIFVLVERIERDPRARLKCIEHFGAQCAACLFDFEECYGELGKGFIHVHHHRLQLADTKGRHIVDPIRDLIPLCPNCHAMVHRRQQMLSVGKLKQIIAACRLGK